MGDEARMGRMTERLKEGEMAEQASGWQRK